MSSRIALLCAAAALLVVPAVPAQEKPTPEKPKGGLKVDGDLPGPFHPYNVANGRYEKKFHSLTNEFGLNPTVMIFAQNVKLEANDPLRKLFVDLDQYIVERPKTRLNAFAVFLYNDLADAVKDDDVREARADEVLKVKTQEPALQKVVLGLDGTSNLQKAGYTLDPQQQVVVVLYDKLKVTKKYEYTDAKMVDVAAIMKEVKENLAPFKK
jgi:hypothetical protein